MSGSNLKAKVEKRSKVAVWFNNIFRTKLEIKTDKLEEMMQASNQNEVRGDTTFFYNRGGLQEEVAKKLRKDDPIIKLNDLSVTYWCDVPKALWKKFQDDSVFNTQLYQRVTVLTDRLVDEWAKRLIHWERLAAEAKGKGDTDRVNEIIKEFEGDCDTLSKECEAVAIETIAGFFTEKAQVFGDYKRYKFKAGAKLVSTFVGMALSIAALSTAATPAAPATIIPAIIGLCSAAMSIGKQIADLAASAEEIEAEIMRNLSSIEVNYKDSKGKPRKKTYQAREFVTGFVSGMTGGASDIFIPSIKGLLDETGLHKSKLDGLEVTLHSMGNTINALVDALGAADTVLEHGIQKLNELLKAKPTDKELQKAAKAIQEADSKFTEANSDFLTAFGEVPAMIERISRGRESNEKLRQSLEQVQAALKTGGIATAGNLLASLALIGIGFSSGDRKSVV